MTDNPCNCETCTNVNRNRLKLCANTNYYCTIQNEFVSYDDEDMIKRVGCLSHPQAREYLMKDVIAELENRHNTTCKQYHDTPCYLAEGNIYEVKRYTLEDVIKLIKEGVKE